MSVTQIRKHYYLIDYFQTGLSKKDILQQRVSQILNTSLENVDVFTVIQSPNKDDMIDVRFSAHGSPYYAPEKLNNKVTQHQDKVNICHFFH